MSNPLCVHTASCLIKHEYKFNSLFFLQRNSVLFSLCLSLEFRGSIVSSYLLQAVTIKLCVNTKLQVLADCIRRRHVSLSFLACPFVATSD